VGGSNRRNMVRRRGRYCAKGNGEKIITNPRKRGVIVHGPIRENTNKKLSNFRKSVLRRFRIRVKTSGKNKRAKFSDYSPVRLFCTKSTQTSKIEMPQEKKIFPHRSGGTRNKLSKEGKGGGKPLFVGGGGWGVGGGGGGGGVGGWGGGGGGGKFHGGGGLVGGSRCQHTTFEFFWDGKSFSTFSEYSSPGGIIQKKRKRKEIKALKSTGLGGHGL